MFAAIRVRGSVDVTPDIKRTLELLRLDRVNHMVLVGEGQRGMLSKVQFYITFGEIDAESFITKTIYKLLHSISHSLVITGSVECGLDKNSLAELIFPSIPAIIIYCSNVQEQTGGMVTLFENNIYPWIDKTIEKVNSCIYDPVCMDYKSSCHACLQLSEFSCVHFNYDLGRDVLIGKTTNTQKLIGFWSREFQNILNE